MKEETLNSLFYFLFFLLGEEKMNEQKGSKMYAQNNISGALEEETNEMKDE